MITKTKFKKLKATAGFTLNGPSGEMGVKLTSGVANFSGNAVIISENTVVWADDSMVKTSWWKVW